MHIPKISIVVPVYGVEKYLNECVDSILSQTFRDIEVILVDDGSKDRCPQIIDEYAKKDSRVVPIHQENGGYGKAVNHGISVARGDFIGIIESDDWIEPNMYEKLYNMAVSSNSDITKCGFYIYNSKNEPHNKKYESHNKSINNYPDYPFSIEECPSLLFFHTSIWSNLYRADFIKNQKVIESNSASYQDVPFIVEAFCRAKSISIVKDYLHHYRCEENMNSSTIRRDERLLMYPVQCMEAKKILKKYGKYDSLKEAFYFHSFESCLGFYRSIFWMHKLKFRDLLVDLFSDLKQDRTFSFKYFDDNGKKIITEQINGRLFGGLGLFGKQIRRFFFRLHLRKSSFLIQIMGIQLTSEDNYDYPTPFIRFKL